ncbi:MAG: methyltransferase [Agarilytica sp.]
MMADTDTFSALALIASQILSADRSRRVLLVADENIDPTIIRSVNLQGKITILSNRFDITEVPSTDKLNTLFSDFDFDALDEQFDVCIYRISKERPVCHHVFNKCLSILDKNGVLIVGGKKNEGIKNYHQKLVKTLGFEGQLKKNGDDYTATLTAPKNRKPDTLLDDKHYQELRRIQPKDAASSFISKPGLYGWNKVDQGSQILIDTLLNDLRLAGISPTRILDLGCGYGYLSLSILDALNEKRISGIEALIATDNNAAAILAAEQNIAQHPSSASLSYRIVADNCAANISTPVDLLICNPPFHQGFDNSRALTALFLNTTKRLLAKKGLAYFVVNSFIPLDTLASEKFKCVTVLSNNRQFKVVRVSHYEP